MDRKIEMTRTLEEVVASLPERERLAIKKRKKELLDEIEGLPMLRSIAERSQKEIAEKLGVKQPSVHKMEKQADLYLSTLRRFVEAAGGVLELRVTLPGKKPFKLTKIGELAG
jgi:DNA-directed RNA polymerase specialized sigma subunit